MNKNTERVFYSRIMLFGEYAVMHQGRGLYMPFYDYEGELTYAPKRLSMQAASLSNQHLRCYASALNTSLSLPGFDTQAFLQEAEKGLTFDATIPQRAGLGSSGALCAALYHRYTLNPISAAAPYVPAQIEPLKRTLAQMESFFHGQSSGMDALSCYIGKPFKYTPSSLLENAYFPKKLSQVGLFLLNTRLPASTQTYVTRFNDMCQQNGFFEAFQHRFIAHTNASIEALLQDDQEVFWQHLREVSAYTATALAPMVPSAYRALWEKGLNTGYYYLKLSGAGGGGIILGFSRNIQQTKACFEPYDIRWFV